MWYRKILERIERESLRGTDVLAVREAMNEIDNLRNASVNALVWIIETQSDGDEGAKCTADMLHKAVKCICEIGHSDYCKKHSGDK